MEVFITLLLIGVCAAFPSTKIVGGNPANITEFPYLVSLEQSEIIQWAHTCGGSILSENAIVTAAHCIVVPLPNAIRFRAGSTTIKEGGTVHRTSTITIHPLFDSETSEYDIAFVTVIEPFEFSESVKTIEPTSTEPNPGELSTVSGWGVLEEGSVSPSKTLQTVDILIGSRQTCEEQYGADAFTKNMICAGYPEGGKDPCLFDSGDPLVVNGTLVGIESGGTGCARPGLYKRYTNVAILKDWILEQISKSKKV